MLHALLDHARSVGLADKPGLLAKSVRWKLTFRESGEFLSFGPIGDPPEKKGKPPAAVTIPDCPHLSTYELSSCGTGSRHFLVDNLQTVARWNTTDKPDSWLEGRHAKYVRLITAAAESDPGLSGLARAFESGDAPRLALAACFLSESGPRPEDDVVIVIRDDAGVEEYAHARPLVQEWWRGFYARVVANRSSKGGGMIPRPCLATGEIVPPIPTHPQITGLSGVGGKGTGDTLATSDKEAYRHFGLDRGEHAPVGVSAAAAYSATLRAMIRESRDFHGTKLIAWRSDLAGDPLARLFDPDAERIPGDSCPAYILRLSGNSGRIVVREWLPTTTSALDSAIDQWYEDLEIAHPWADGVSGRFGIETVIDSLVDLHVGNGKVHSSSTPAKRALAEPLFSAAVGGRGVRIPRTVISAVVRRQEVAYRAGWVSDLTSGREAIDYDPDAIPVRVVEWAARMAVLRAAWVREGDEESMGIGLNRDHSSPIYHAGRLLAVLYHAKQVVDQERSGGKIRSGFPSTLEYTRELRNHERYMRALSRKNGHASQRIIAILQGIYEVLSEAPPTRIPPGDKPLFDAGFYHQQAELPRSFGIRTPTEAGVDADSIGEAAGINYLFGLSLTNPPEKAFSLEVHPTIHLPRTGRWRIPDAKLVRDGKRPIYWEHRGMMEMRNYRRGQDFKDLDYASVGIHPLPLGGDGGILLVTTQEDVDDGFARFEAALEDALALD